MKYRIKESIANKEEQQSKAQEQVTLPNELPNIQMNELEYEQGFDEKSLGIQSTRTSLSVRFAVGYSASWSA